MRLSPLEKSAYNYLTRVAPQPVSITVLITECYKEDQPQPRHARNSLTTVLRSLIEKAPLMKLPYQIERVSPIGPRVGQYRAISSGNVSQTDRMRKRGKKG